MARTRVLELRPLCSNRVQYFSSIELFMLKRSQGFFHLSAEFFDHFGISDFSACFQIGCQGRKVMLKKLASFVVDHAVSLGQSSCSNRFRAVLNPNGSN